MNTEHELVFALSYPVQVSVAGMTTAFMVLLALHQCFTAAYHFPLDPLNFVLQLVSSIVYVVYHGATLGVQLRELDEFSHRWPHMFPYMAYRLPRYGHWTTVQMVFFILAEALASLLAHAAHIQFLMLLFPSKLERRLIFWLLGPFVLIETGLFFVDLVPPDHVKVLDLSDAMMNICDSSLALLYMSGLLVWGGLVNWRRAWRADGSTAAFGVAALLVALQDGRELCAHRLRPRLLAAAHDRHVYKLAELARVLVVGVCGHGHRRVRGPPACDGEAPPDEAAARLACRRRRRRGRRDALDAQRDAAA